MKLPNGYGSIVKLSGKRRNPYCARKTIGWETTKDGKIVQKRMSAYKSCASLYRLKFKEIIFRILQTLQFQTAVGFSFA